MSNPSSSSSAQSQTPTSSSVLFSVTPPPPSPTSQPSLTSSRPSSTSAAPSTPPVTTTLTTTVTDSTPTPTPAPTSTASKESGNDHRNNILITGIVIGVVGFLLVGGVLFLFRRRKKRRALMRKNKAEEHHHESYRSETTNNTTFMLDESSDRELLVVLQTVSDTGDFPTDVRHDVGDLLIQNRSTVLRIPSSVGSAETLFDTYTLQNSSIPVSDFEGEKQQEDKIPISHPENPRRLSQTLRDNYIPNDTANLNLTFQQRGRPLPTLPVAEMQPVADSGLVYTTTEVASPLRLNSTALPADRWHADSGVRLGRETLQYDDGTTSEWSLRSKDRLPPVYTHN